MTNSADPDQLASLEANWSGSTLFAKIACHAAREGLKEGLFLELYIKYLTQFFFYISDAHNNSIGDNSHTGCNS